MHNLSDKPLVKEKFSKFINSYDKYAIIQKRVIQDIEKTISKFLKSQDIFNNKNILEIGCGTGFFSKEISSIFSNSKIIFSDLSKIIINKLKSNIKKTNNKYLFKVIDGEKFKLSKHYDFIFSSSTFQWFSFLQDAINNFVGHLSSDGYFIFSMFTGDTLKFFYLFLQDIKKEVNIPIYYKYKDIIKFLKLNNLHIVYSKEIKYNIEFEQANDLLKMMKYTGTTGLKLLQNNLTKSDILKIDKLYYKKYNFVKEYFFSSIFIAKKIT